MPLNISVDSYAIGSCNATLTPIFRLLDPISRQLIMNLLWLEPAIPASTMAAWVTREGKP